MKASKDKLLSNNQTCIQQLKILAPTLASTQVRSSPVSKDTSVESTMHASLDKYYYLHTVVWLSKDTCFKNFNQLQKPYPYPASKTFGSDSASTAVECISIKRCTIHASWVKIGPVVF